jgi:hypothetical protein
MPPSSFATIPVGAAAFGKPRHSVPWLLGIAGAFLVLVAGCDGSSTGPDDDPVLDCTPSNTLALAVGGSVYRAGRDARTLCIGGEPGAEYVLVPVPLKPEPGGSVPLSLVAEGTIGSTTTPQPSPSGAPARFGTLVGADPGEFESAIRDHAFDHALRERERRELLPLVRPAGAAAPPTHPAAAPPVVGQLLTLNAQSRNACTNPVERTGEVMAISGGAIVVADTARPAGGFTQAQFEHFAAAFDTLVAPVVEHHFGSPTDLDANGGVILFFTPEVNRLTESGSERYVAGFFFSRDLFPRTATARLQACATSNVGEILYLMAPDPLGSVNGNRRSVEFVNRVALGAIGHEYQHLVNGARRIHVLELAQPFEDVWLNEGLSHTAEELLFFEASGLPTRANLDLADLQQAGPRAVEAANAFHVPNLQRFIRFLERSEMHAVYDSSDTLEGRGASQQFLRYAADRLPQGDAAFLRALTDAPETGLANLAGRLGGEANLRRWLADWAVAIYADDRVPGLAPQHRLQSWSHPTIFEGLQVTSYPARTRFLSPTQPIDLTMRAGGILFARFTVPGPDPARILVSSGAGPLPDYLALTLLRTR